MSLQAGQQLGSYEITSLLGKGGMGEVYRARDPKLGRDVAIKVLPEDFAMDADRSARFVREARVLASLNHSHIGAIYDLQKASGVEFLILELIEGETLADRIARGPIPVEEAIAFAKQIAEALAGAHEKGVVHRDLKPANIKITPDGMVKVLDFGLAKIYEVDPADVPLSNSPTLMSGGAGGAVILGTVSYMSPEQARGRTVTKQTDIWAFGCVLFEMLTARLAFSGETVSDTIAKILKEEPDWSALSTEVPAAVRRVIERCLSKDLRRRLHDAGDIRIEIEEASVTPSPNVGSGKKPSSRSLILLSSALLIALVTVAGLLFRPGKNNPVPVWTGTRLGGTPIAYGPTISPDGKMLAFQAFVDGQSQVAVMNPQSGNWRLLTRDKDAGWVSHLSWSKDGTKIYFDRGSVVAGNAGVFSIPALGGEPHLIVDNAQFPDALPDGRVIFVRLNANRNPQLHRFDPATGQVSPLDAIVSDATELIPVGYFRAFPDGAQVVFFGRTNSSADSRPHLNILDLNTNKSHPIGPDLGPGTFSGGLAVNPIDGSVLINARNGDLNQVVAIPTRETAAPHVLLTLTGNGAFMDMAADGSLYVDQMDRPTQILRFTEHSTTPEILATISVEECTANYSTIELPDGRVLLTTVFDGRPQLIAAKPNGEMSPILDADEQTSGPATLVGPNQVAFILGKPPQQSIAVVSIKDGRLVQRRKTNAGNVIRSLSASADGATLFYSDAGSIWSMPTDSGEARKLGPGDYVAFDPLRHDLVVQLNDKLARMPAAGGNPEVIRAQGEPGAGIIGPLGPNGVRPDGLIVITGYFRDSWFSEPALLDPVSGSFRRIPLRYEADVLDMVWNQKNQIVSPGCLVRSSLWRFRLQN